MAHTSPDILDPKPADKALLEADAPQLLPLLTAWPTIRIYTRSHPDFEMLRMVLAARTEDLPLALIRVISEEEIAAAILACEGASIPIAVRSGGNDFGDRNYVDGGVTVDVQLLNSIVISPDRCSAQIGGGVTLGQLLYTLDKHNLDTPCGWGHQVGYVGWACGGGYSTEVGTRGLGVDQILAGRIVTASGHVIDASPNGDTDAYWALRGGGAGIVGIVSQLTIKVYPKPKILAGSIAFPFSEVEAVFLGFEQLLEHVYPDKFAGDSFIVNPPGSGGLFNHFFWWHLDDDESDLVEAQAFLHRIKQLGTVMVDTVSQTTPYEFLYSIQNPIIEERQYFANASCTVAGMSLALGKAIASHPLPTDLSVIVLHQCHGSGSKEDAGAAYANRSRHLLVGISASCPYSDVKMRKLISSWPHDLLADVTAAELPLPRKYINFNPREPRDGRLYFGDNGVARMQAIKSRLDPNNIFAACTPDLE